MNPSPSRATTGSSAPRQVSERLRTGPASTGSPESNRNTRRNFYENAVGAEFSKHIHAAGTLVSDSTLAHSTQELLRIRASQINNSSVCTRLHVTDAAHLGETSLRLNLIATWRVANVFTDAERAALELTEQGTRIADVDCVVPEQVWDNAAKHYDGEQLAALVAQIALINIFNRINIITQATGQRLRAGPVETAYALGVPTPIGLTGAREPF